MDTQNHRTVKFLLFVAATLSVVGCGGKQSMASKSAAAYRDAVARGIPVASGHGGHMEGSASAGSGHDDMAGMNMGSATGGQTPMSSMPNMPGMSAMDHSTMQKGSASGMANMPGMKQGSMAGMSGMDHSKMQKNSTSGMANMPGMQHGSMSGMSGMQADSMSGMKGMDHSQMQHGSAQNMANMPGMEHGSMSGMSNMPGMQHGSMSGMQTGAMGNMGNMAGMQHGAAAVPPPPPAPTNSSGIAKLSPASTLNADSFDQPAPIAVAEANKSAAGGADTMHMESMPSGTQQPPAGSPPPKPPDHSHHGAGSDGRTKQ